MEKFVEGAAIHAVPQLLRGQRHGAGIQTLEDVEANFRIGVLRNNYATDGSGFDQTLLTFSQLLKALAVEASENLEAFERKLVPQKSKERAEPLLTIDRGSRAVPLLGEIANRNWDIDE